LTIPFGLIPIPKKGKIQTILSKSENLECSIEQVIRKYFDENIEYIKELELIAKAFDLYKKTSNLMDYDDLMVVLRDNLKKNNQFRAILQKSINYILVDEYQDTNNSQREIVELISGNHGRVTVVGDDSQSIYAFRGANFENILRFPQNFPECGVVKIEENYRSEQGILNFTNDIILHAKVGFKKKLFSQRFTGKKPIVKRFPDGIVEAEYIVDKVLEIRTNNLEFSDFSILTRASWHSNYVQTELIKRKIPFMVVGGIKFSERRHVKDVIAFLKISINPIDAIAWHRILQLIEGVGKVRAKELVENIHKRNGVIDFSEFAGRKYFPEIKKLEELFNRIIDNHFHVQQIIDVIFEYYRPILQQLEDDYEVRLKDLEVFRIITEKYDDIEKFIADFTLEPPSNRYQDQTTPLTEMEGKPLVVSTIHSAKGLEWHTVFVPFALDGLIPSSRSLGSLEEIEEERRLFYVASSRAKENLFITMPSYVGSWDAVFTKPSRFIYEINKDHYFTE
jgi:DNA helicase-2/ATP-dependent DNA helicase PcrA